MIRELYQFEKLLKNELSKCHIDKLTIDKICVDINSRICSFTRHNTEDFVNTLFFFGHEEADFYESGEIFLNNFLLLNIRNSKLAEYVHDDKQIRKIMDMSYDYFSNNMDILKTPLKCDDDIYGNIKDKYHEAWDIIYALANSGESRMRYKFCDNVQDVSEELCSEIKKVIDDTHASNLPVFTDSIKCITRDIKELYKMVTYILAIDCSLVTPNYYIANGYSEKRKEWVKATDSKEIERNSMRAIKKNLTVENSMSELFKSVLIFYSENL